MKIAIQGHPTRGKEVIQILKDLGGKGSLSNFGYNERMYYWINSNDIILESLINIKTKKEFNLYTLEEFEKEFPFKIGDEIRDCSDDEVGIITDLLFIDNMLMYNVNFINSGQVFIPTEQLKFHKEMKGERNITLTLDKAREWYNKGGELKEIALQAFTEQELNPLPRSWEEFCLCINKIHSEDISIPLKYRTLRKLEILRNIYRQGWEPNWLDSNEMKYIIKGWKDKIAVNTTYVLHSFLSFPNYDLALEFQKCFGDLIEKAGDLI